MLEKIFQLSLIAGEAIMDIYNSKKSLNVKQKKDNSPVTIADISSHRIIKDGLEKLTPEIPILSEEETLSWEIRKHWVRYWLVDPLDGTQEFLQRNGEFTINIALIEHGKTVMGVIYAPLTDVAYLAKDKHAWKEKKGQRHLIHINNAQPPVIVVNRSHIDMQLKSYLKTINKYELMFISSSLKFCLVAEGTAQLYPCFGLTNIWDTAAGHAIADAAGAKISDWKGCSLLYTPRKSFFNPEFKVSI
ncbi:3'(2'),5'-bisphosphate nucleotidase CysQ [Candidatus Ecksteinia adelgidicola]|nr:3'(2'),5'-bisphosphate nucleotidase CysQ [Candidatus Ecksteinia adelgidicola]